MVRYPVPLAAGYLWPPGGREALAPGRQGSSGPWAAGKLWVGHLTDLPWNPRPPVAIPGELEGIPEEVSGWNGSELNSERIHVRFSRNRRWNSGGWHRPGKAESGGFWGCRGPPDFFRAAARGRGGTRRTPRAHQAHTRRTPGNQPKTGVRRGDPLQRGHHCACAVGCSWRPCRGPWAAGDLWPLAAGKLWPLAAGYLWPLGGRESPPRWSSHGSSPPAGHLTDMPWGAPWSSHGSALGGPLVISRIPPPGSPASGRDSGRAREDSRGSFWMEWLRIEF